jgi:hypothetical protein
MEDAGGDGGDFGGGGDFGDGGLGGGDFDAPEWVPLAGAPSPGGMPRGRLSARARLLWTIAIAALTGAFVGLIIGALIVD